MTYGFYCENESGFVQVDGTYDNFAVFASGTANSGSGNTAERVYFPAGTPDDYLIFAKPTVETGFTTLAYGTDLTATSPTGSYFFFADQYGVYTTVSVDWIIAIRSKELAVQSDPNVGYGFNVYKDTGEIAYSTNNQAFRCSIVTFVDYNNASNFSQVPISSMAGVYTNMNSKTIFGSVPVSSQQTLIYSLFADFDYVNSEIGETPRPVFSIPIGGTSVVFGGGRKTSIWGTFK
jgi:hypothetical protein